MTSAPLFSDAWLAECNAALAALPGLDDAHGPLVVTELVVGAPPGAHAAVSLIADHEGVRLVPGDEGAASAWLTVSMDDAEALHTGGLDPATALTEGRIRVRGDLRAVVELVSVLVEAHARLRAR